MRVREGAAICLTFILVGTIEGKKGYTIIGPDCWFSTKCQMDKPILVETLSPDEFPTLEDQALECHKRCNQDPLCKFFTVNQFRNQGTCYHLDHCEENEDDNCITHGACVSGPRDCDCETPNKNCPKIAPQNTPKGTVHWQCHDNFGNTINGYHTKDIKSSTVCMLRCESWRDQAGNPGYLESECQDDGTWSQTVANDGSSELAFPPKPFGGEYPTPATVSTLDCNCENLEVKWPVDATDEEDRWWYDPNMNTDGTVFVCEHPVNTTDGDYVIEGGNSCKLFCDTHLVNVFRCQNGEWTGNPEFGFWCYEEPEKENQQVFRPTPTISWTSSSTSTTATETEDWTKSSSSTTATEGPDMVNGLWTTSTSATERPIATGK